MEETFAKYINVNGELMDLSRPQVMGILNVTPDSFYADTTGCKAIRLQPLSRNVPHILTPLNQGQRYEKFRKIRGIIWIRI